MKNSTIDINTTTVRAKIELLKAEKEKIDKTLEEFKGGSLKINEFWTGNTGDKVSDKLKDYITKFDYISIKLSRFIKYLEMVCNAYDKEDDNTNKAMETFLTKLPLEKGNIENYEYTEEQ